MKIPAGPGLAGRAGTIHPFSRVFERKVLTIYWQELTAMVTVALAAWEITPRLV
jgi:hypothetical protein